MISSAYRRAERTRKAVGATLVLSALLTGMSVPSVAADTDTKLRGRVQESDRVTRLARPKTPVLQAASSATTPKQQFKAFVDFGDSDFAKTMARQEPEMPTIDGTESGDSAPAVQASVDDNELVIAWEEWYRRVTKAIYERWSRNSTSLGLIGRAHVSISVTRDRKICVNVSEVQLDTDVLPENVPGMLPHMQAEFAGAIVDSVQPLNGSMILDFPEKSRRAECTWTPYFEATSGTRSFYEWKKNDYERVHEN